MTLPRPSYSLSLRASLCLGVLFLLAHSSTALAQVELGGELPGPLPLFPVDNWWNVDVSSAPLDEDSDDYINWINTGGRKRCHPDFGGDSFEPPPDPLIYGMVYIVVPGTTPLDPLTFFYDDQSDYGAPGRPLGYPIPIEARTQEKWIEGGYAGGGNSGDRHMLIVDRDNRILYELFATHWDDDEERWEAGSGAIFDLDANDRRPDTWTSADAAGLAILPGLVRYDEVYGPDPIRHAFRFTTRATNGYAFPASHRAGDTEEAPPMGTRLRLKADKDISGFSAPIRKIFQAMKTYGIILADNGTDMYITGTYNTDWDNGILNPAFHSLYADDFEVIELGWQPEPSAAPNAIEGWEEYGAR